MYRRGGARLLAYRLVSGSLQRLYFPGEGDGGGGDPDPVEPPEFPTEASTGLAGVGLTEGDLTVYDGPAGYNGSDTIIIENKIVNHELRVYDSVQMIIRRSKINGNIDIASPNASLLMEDTLVDCGTWGNASVGFENMTIRRCDIRGGITAVNAVRNTVVENSILHKGYLPPTGDVHMGGFLCSGGHDILVDNCTIVCNNPLNQDGGGPSGTAQLYGDFGDLYNITFDHCYFRATTGGYVTSFGYDPGWPSTGKPYGANTRDIVVKDCVYERGPNGAYKGGGYGTTTSWPALDPGSVWSNNTWDDGTPIGYDA